MRAFLSSYRFGAHQNRLLDLLGERRGRVAVIANACDAWSPSARESAVQSELRPLRELGFTPIELDLRECDDGAHVRRALTDVDLVWVRGGNTYVLRNQLARSGADLVLVEALADDEFVYAGYSAGACVCAPTLRGLEHSDDPLDTLVATGDRARWDGLGLVPYCLIPHWESALAVPEANERTLSDLAGVPVLTLTDDEVVIVNGTSITKY